MDIIMETKAETKESINQILNRISHLSSLIRRSQLHSAIGETYDGDRDLYEIMGYKRNLSYEDYVNIASREGIPKRINNAPCDAVWCQPPRIYDMGSEREESKFEKEFVSLANRLSIWSKFNRVDKLLGFGNYAVILLGFDDVKNRDGFMLPLDTNRDNKLLYIQCYPAEHASINQSELNASNERYGLPLYYNITPKGLGSISVHYLRVIHVLEENLTNEIEGEPRLKCPFNRLQDIRKIISGSSEMFWRGARPGHVAKLDEGFKWDEADPTLEKMKEQLDEYEHNLRRLLYLQGVTVTPLDMQISDPSAHLDAQLTDLSAGTRIPKRILSGSESAELASSQDRANWTDYIDERRIWFAEPVIIRPFINVCLMAGVLPAPEGDEYYIAWPSLKIVSDKDKADAGRIRSESLKNYLQMPGADMVLSPEMFLRFIMSFNDDIVREIKAQQEEILSDGLKGDDDESNIESDIEPDTETE